MFCKGIWTAQGRTIHFLEAARGALYRDEEVWPIEGLDYGMNLFLVSSIIDFGGGLFFLRYCGSILEL